MELDIVKSARARKLNACLKAALLTGLVCAFGSGINPVWAQTTDIGSSLRENVEQAAGTAGQAVSQIGPVSSEVGQASQIGLQISQTDPQIDPSATTKRRPKIGLALGGGGMRGAAHIGVLEVLEREGVHVDYIAGTSMGSVVGGLYAAGVPICKLEEKFTDGVIMKHFMTAPIGVRLALAPAFLPLKVMGSHQYDGLYRGNIFRKFLDKSVPQDDKNIESFKIPFCAVALNLIDGKPYALGKGNFGRTLQASCALPLLRRPVRIDDKLFVDGGVLVNLPTQQVRDMGADIIIAVDIDESIDDIPMNEFEKFGSVAHRVVCLHLAKVDQESLKLANIVIHPAVNGIRMVSTKRKDAKTAVAAGVAACEKAMPEILKLVGPENLMVQGRVLGAPPQKSDTTKN